MKDLYQIQFRAMGCNVLVQLQSKSDVKGLLNTIPTRFENYESILSRFRSSSELMKFNSHAGQWVKVSNVLFENIQAAKQAARITEGWFNPLILPALISIGYDRSFEQIGNSLRVETVLPIADWQSIELDKTQNQVRIPKTTTLDLGGIAKGWVAAKLADELGVYGACAVNIGGDIALRGFPNKGRAWEVNVEDALLTGNLVSVSLTDTHIVTSGIDFRRWQAADGEIYNHIINPFTGRSAQSDVLSATVIHPHAPTAEAYAKVLILMGADKGFNWLHQQWQGAALIIKQDGSVLSNSHFSQFISERSYS